jgi:alpha-D-ribose 1-methylphosphonate 5-triphosphate diphosphatase PhnM
MHGVLLKLIAGDDGEVTLDIKEARSVADAIAKLSMAQKLDTDNTLRIRREMADKAAKAVEKAVDESGAPDKAELLKRIRQDIYGLVG